MKQVIVYSHGFGVEKDDRGLFTDITSILPTAKHVMFDYNQVDKTSQTLTTASLTDQRDHLLAVLKGVRAEYPDAVIDMVCHSQGCVVAAMAMPTGVRKVIFLAPPSRFAGIDEKLKQMSERPGTKIEKDKTVSYPRRDGSTTIVTPDYWRSREGVVPIELFNRLATSTKLVVVNANQDEVLGSTDFSELSPEVSVIYLDAGHDFTGEARKAVIENVREQLDV